MASFTGPFRLDASSGDPRLIRAGRAVDGARGEAVRDERPIDVGSAAMAEPEGANSPVPARGSWVHAPETVDRLGDVISFGRLPLTALRLRYS
jgi:hypothetical protein